MDLTIKAKHTTLFLLFCSAATFQQGFAQTGTRNADSVIQTQQFNVYQEYTPEVQKKTKEAIIPEMPKFDTINPVYKYTVPEQKLTYKYQAVPIRPLALGLNNQAPQYENYIKAGAGNYRTILVDAGISNIQGKNFQSVIHGQHLSQKGGITNRQSSRTAIDGIGYYQFQNHDLEIGAAFNRVGAAAYGRNSDTFRVATLDSLRQVYWGARAHVALENGKEKKLTYKPQIGASYYTDRRAASEVGFNIAAPFQYKLAEDIKAGININGDFYSYTVNKAAIANNLFALSPYIDFKALESDARIGLIAAFGKNNKFYLLPDLRLSIPLIKDKLVVNGGVKGEVIQNTFEQLSSKNPFMHNSYLVQQTSQMKAFTGFDYNLTDKITFGGSVSWNQWKNLPMFINDYGINSNGSFFNVIYDDKVQAVMFDGYFKYQINETFGLIGSGAWTSFTYKETADKIYHEPQLKLGGALFVKPFKGLYTSVKLDYWDRIFYITETGASEKLLPLVDLSLQAEYQIIPRLSLFLQVNNILNKQYERYNLYNVYGINAIGGLRLKF